MPRTTLLQRCTLAFMLIAFAGIPASRACPAGKGFLVRPMEGNISRGFGMTLNPLTGARAMHTGIDIDAPIGGPVKAAEAGTVISITTQGPLGKVVRLRHGGSVESQYAHLSRIGVSEGDCLDTGGELGAVGETGISSHPHLHFEIIEKGHAANPLRYLHPKQQ